MTRKEALAELIEKVEAGAVRPHEVFNFFDMPCQDAALQQRAEDAKNAYSGSLDAAKALHEALLPGWPYTIENVTGQTCRAWTNKSRNLRRPGFSDRGPCPARAWLLAILRALYAQEPDT